MPQPEREARSTVGHLFAKFMTTQSPNLQFMIFLLGNGISLLPTCLRDFVLFPVENKIPKPPKVRSGFIKSTQS